MFGNCPCCLFRIKIKKDTQFLMLLNYAENTCEQEILLPIGAKFVVRDVHYMNITNSNSVDAYAENNSYEIMKNGFIERAVIDLDYIGMSTSSWEEFITDYFNLLIIHKENI